MHDYRRLLTKIINTGRARGDRTGTGTVSIFGEQMRFNLAEAFPLLTLKSTPFKAVAAELKWFLEGSTDNKRLNELGSTIWDKWAVAEDVTFRRMLDGPQRAELYATKYDRPLSQVIKMLETLENYEAGLKFLTDDGVPTEADVVKTPRGALGPIYGKQWRQWTGIVPGSMLNITMFVDQIAELIKGLKSNPYSRRHIVSAWNASDLPDESKSPQDNVKDGKMALAPCHTLFQCYITDMTLEERIAFFNRDNTGLHMAYIDAINEDQSDLLDKVGVPTKSLSLQLYMRSVDVPVGLPFNIASYALLTHLLANECGYAVNELIVTVGDAHVYVNQLSQVDEMLERTELDLPLLDLPMEINVTSFSEPSFDLREVVGSLRNYKAHPAIKIPVAV